MGHGHVTPNPDGLKARCGGPPMCSVCQQEAAADKSTVDEKIERTWWLFDAQRKLRDDMTEKDAFKAQVVALLRRIA